MILKSAFERFTGQNAGHEPIIKEVLIANALSPNPSRNSASKVESPRFKSRELPKPNGVSPFGRAFAIIDQGNNPITGSILDTIKVLMGLSYGFLINVPGNIFKDPMVLRKLLLKKGEEANVTFFNLLQTTRDREYLEQLRNYLNPQE